MDRQADARLWMQDLRIDFQFDRAAFDFKLLPFKVPYPVPFKLFGDETKVALSSASHHHASICPEPSLLPVILLSTIRNRTEE